MSCRCSPTWVCATTQSSWQRSMTTERRIPWPSSEWKLSDVIKLLVRRHQVSDDVKMLPSDIIQMLYNGKESRRQESNLVWFRKATVFCFNNYKIWHFLILAIWRMILQNLCLTSWSNCVKYAWCKPVTACVRLKKCYLTSYTKNYYHTKHPIIWTC